MLSQQDWLVAQPDEIMREKKDEISTSHPFGYFLTGIRRSGKSTLLRQLMEKQNCRNYFNFEDTRITDFSLNDFLILEELFSKHFGNNSIIFFDEIQNIDQWEKYVRDAIDRGKAIVITGSNAKLLSKELGTKLTGRHLDYEIFPFSFNEFLSFFNLEANSDSLLRYLKKGGFPGYLQLDKAEILSMLVSDILERDIFARHNLKNQNTYRRVVQFILSNISKEISFNSISKSFEIGSPSSVMEFIGYLIDAYLIFLVPRFNFSLKVQARNPRKVYAIDTGLVDFYSLSASPDSGRLLENAAFLYFRQQNKEIWYYKGKKECDFIVRNHKSEYSAIQVCWKVEQENMKRETEGLIEAMDYLGLNEGFIYTFDQEDEMKADHKIIHLYPFWKK